MISSFSFVANRTSCNTLELLRTDIKVPAAAQKSAVTLEVIKSGLTANNTFYIRLGDEAPFNFFKCYPVDSKAELVKDKTLPMDGYVHPPAWGLAKVLDSTVESIPVGSTYLGHLPIGTHVSFKSANVNNDGNMVIERAEVDSAYNVFYKIDEDDALLTEAYGDVALVCWPGIITGFGCYFTLQKNNFYGANNLVITSASSKVALALAFYLKDSGRRVIGYTSELNKKFCEETGLYSQVLSYDDLLDPDEKYLFIDIIGSNQIYNKNKGCVTKLIAIGNTAGALGKDSTFGIFPFYDNIKFVLTIMGAPRWTRSWMNPSHELYLVLDSLKELKAEWGLTKYNTLLKEHTHRFCASANNWLSVKKCDSEESIKKAFVDIVEGKVPPSEVIVLDVPTAVSGRL